MVSLDDAEKNAAFAESLSAEEIPVVSDPTGRVAKEYGVLALGGLYARRWTFYIDADGRIAHVDQDVAPATAGADMLGHLKRLNFPKLQTPATESIPSPEVAGP